MMSYHSCAELETILNEAAIRAAFARKDSIGMEDMVGMVLKQQYGASEDVPHNSEEAVKKAAAHEAGHLVACEILSPEVWVLLPCSPPEKIAAAVSSIIVMCAARFL